MMKVLLLTWKSGDFVADVANYLPPFLLVVSIPWVYLGHNIYLGYYYLGPWKFLDFENVLILKIFQLWNLFRLWIFSSLKIFRLQKLFRLWNCFERIFFYFENFLTSEFFLLLKILTFESFIKYDNNMFLFFIFLHIQMK